MTSRAAAITAAGATWAAALAELDDTCPRAQAEAAWLPGGPSVEELTARIRARRGLADPTGRQYRQSPAKDRGAA